MKGKEAFNEKKNIINITRSVSSEIIRYLSMMNCIFLLTGLGYRSEILPEDKKSYLTHAILPRLSNIGCIGTHAHGHTSNRTIVPTFIVTIV